MPTATLGELREMLKKAQENGKKDVEIDGKRLPVEWLLKVLRNYADASDKSDVNLLDVNEVSVIMAEFYPPTNDDDGKGTMQVRISSRVGPPELVALVDVLFGALERACAGCDRYHECRIAGKPSVLCAGGTAKKPVEYSPEVV